VQQALLFPGLDEADLPVLAEEAFAAARTA